MPVVIKLLLTVLILMILCLTLFLTFLQSHYAAPLVHWMVSTFTPYQVQAQSVHYDISNPWQITINSVKGQSITSPFSADKITFKLHPFQSTQNNLAFSFIEIDNPNLPFETALKAASLSSLPRLSIDHLRITNLSLNAPTWAINNASLSIKNWQSIPDSMTPTFKQWQLLVPTLQWQNHAFTNLLINGSNQSPTWAINGLSFQWKDIDIVGQGEYNSVNSSLTWHQLNVSNIKLNNAEQLQDILQNTVKHLQLKMPRLRIHFKEVLAVNANLEATDWGINNLSLQLHNWTWPQDQWQQTHAKLSIQAQSVRWHDDLWNMPHLEMAFDDQSIAINTADSQWKTGTISLSGTMTPQRLQLSHLKGRGLETSWTDLSHPFLRHLPFTQINVGTLHFNQQLIFDQKTHFALNATRLVGEKLTFKKTDQWTFWDGTLSGSANSGQWQGLMFDTPTFTIESHQGYSKLIDFQLPIQEGIFIMTGHRDLTTPHYPWQLQGKIENLPATVFSRWLSAPLHLTGQLDGHWQIKGASNSTQALKHSLSGEASFAFTNNQLQHLPWSQQLEEWKIWTPTIFSFPIAPLSSSPQTTPIQIAPIKMTFDRGRIHLPPTSLVTYKAETPWSMNVEATWDLVDKKNHAISWRIQSDCEQWQRNWDHNQQRIDWVSCEGNNK